MKELTSCPICEIGIDYTNLSENKSNESYKIECPRCGIYIISSVMIDSKESMKKYRQKLSGIIRYYTDTKQKTLTILSTTLEEILSNPIFPSKDDIERKSKFLVDGIRRRTQNFGDLVIINDSTDASLGFAENNIELSSLLDLLEEKKYVKVIARISGIEHKIRLTAKGFSLENKLEDTDQVFIAVWFDNPDKKLISLIEKVINETGYKPKCIKEEQYPETILDKALGEIRKSKFVVVDLSGLRGPVFYEAGFASGLNIPVIFICKKNDKEKREFYTSSYKINEYSSHSELEEILKSAITARFSKNS